MESRFSPLECIEKRFQDVREIGEQLQRVKDSNFLYYGYRVTSSVAIIAMAGRLSKFYPELRGPVGAGGAVLSGLVFGWNFVGYALNEVHITWYQAKLIHKVDKGVECFKHMRDAAEASSGSAAGGRQKEMQVFNEAMQKLLMVREVEVRQRAGNALFDAVVREQEGHKDPVDRLIANYEKKQREKKRLHHQHAEEKSCDKKEEGGRGGGGD